MVGLVYVLAGAVVFLPGLLSPAEWAGTEGRRVQIALEMLQHQQWLVPKLGGEPTLSKPPLHYWVLAILMAWVGDAPWLLRLPGPLAFVGLACLAHALLRRTYGPGAAWCAGLGVLTAPLVVALVPRAEIDPLFAALAAAAILLLSYGAAFAASGHVLAGAAVAGFAMLVKGPPFLMLFAGTAIVWMRRRRGQGLGRALVMMLLAPAAYYVALDVAVDQSLLEVARAESLGRMTLFTWAHVLDTPLHFLRALAASLPFALFLWFEYRGERYAEPDPRETFVRMTAAAAFSTALILVFFPARPARYLLPAVPLFFVAVSPAVAAFAATPVLPALGRGIVRLIAGVAACALLAAPWLPAPVDVRVALGLAAFASMPLWVRTPRHAVAAMMAAAAVAAWTLLAPFAHHRAMWREPFALGGSVLARALAQRDVTDLATLLHVPAPLLLHAAVLPAGDEFAQRQPTAPWLLTEANARPQEAWQHLARVAWPLAGYQARVRLQLPRMALLLWERQ
jgi:4-amino-4-deoxy-L-arabinose transferase-like glycosyltransferase